MAVLQSLLVLPLGVSGSTPSQADEDGGWNRSLDRPGAADVQLLVAGRPGSRESGEALDRLISAEIEAASPPVQEALLLLEIPEEIAAEGPY